jgi:Polysaccharide biosynthesis enzyme WcbI
LRPAGRRKVVMIGNCQSETLRQGFAQIESLNRRYDVKYHFVQLPKNLREFAARDLETCDVLLVQDIRLWDAFPLRDSVRPGAEVARFPLVRFASLWPFDAWNGPGDREAHAREAPNLTFPYLDGLLGRLRREIPDPNARFRAYRSLDWPGIVNYRRLHDMEVRRLGGMDQQFGVAIGAFILENFRTRRLFHTTVRPNWEVFTLLLQFVANLLGAREPISLTERIDRALRNPQVPVHPKVARDLGAAWADERTRYLNRGREVRWEDYIRSYIDHYG